MNNTFNKQPKNQKASALIIVIVLISMLSIVGITLVLISHAGSIGTESMSRARIMNAAVSHIVDRIGDVIAEDVYNSENYDFPGDDDKWLASLEPYVDFSMPQNDPNRFIWSQISDSLGQLNRENIRVKDVHVDPTGLSDSNGKRETIDEYQEIFVAETDGAGYTKGDLLKGKRSLVGTYEGQWADADGDGVADSKWFVVPNVKTASGENYYAAVRIIDNSGMINVNTAYKDARRVNYPAASDYLFYGDSQLSVNLEGLLNFPSDNIEDVFDERRAGDNWEDYKKNVVDRLSNPDKNKDYPIFGTPDEISLRDRFCINPGYNSRVESILEKTLNGTSLNGGWGAKDRPYMGGAYGTLLEWCEAITGGTTTVDPDRRHLLTTMSNSREMTPVQITATDLAAAPYTEVLLGMRKAFINKVDETTNVEKQTLEQLAGNIYYPIKDEDFKGTFGDYITPQRLAWHHAINLADYQDTDSNPSYRRIENETYFGFEGLDSLRDNTLIVSEIAYYDNTGNAKPALPKKKYYLLEIYNPSNLEQEITYWNNYEITIIGQNNIVVIDLYRDIFRSRNNSIGGGQVILVTNDKASSSSVFGVSAGYEDGSLIFSKNDIIFVHKLDWPVTVQIDQVNMPVDKCEVTLLTNGPAGVLKSAQRRDEIGLGSGILLPGSWDASVGVSLGTAPSIRKTFDLNLQVTNEYIPNIGEIGNVFAVGAYADSDDMRNDMPFTSAIEEAIAKLGDTPLKNWGRFDFNDSNARDIFNYITVFKTAWDGVDNDGNPLTTDKPMFDLIDNDADGTVDNNGEEKARYRETIVHGRININTASAKVLEQLPFMTEKIAQAVVARRDARELLSSTGILIKDYTTYAGRKGFRNIAEILEATNNEAAYKDYDIQKYGKTGNSLDSYPDFYPDDFEDDYKERDIIFQRISNSLTINSDVFTAYILLRSGANGEQQRYMAIYDRSRVYESGDKPKIVIQQQSLIGR